jgi:hypothetical protein
VDAAEVLEIGEVAAEAVVASAVVEAIAVVAEVGTRE